MDSPSPSPSPGARQPRKAAAAAGGSSAPYVLGTAAAGGSGAPQVLGTAAGPQGEGLTAASAGAAAIARALALDAQQRCVGG